MRKDEDRLSKISNPSITDFKLDKKSGKLVNPYDLAIGKNPSPMYLYGIVIGHLWIIDLISHNGYGKFLDDIIDYAECNSLNLVEWMLTEEQIKDINSILSKYKLTFEKKIVAGINVYNYKDEFEGLKTKNHPYNVLSRYLHLIKGGHSKAFKGLFSEITNIEDILKEYFTVINATYLGIISSSDYEDTVIKSIPENVVKILTQESLCSVEYKELKYYPKNGGAIPYITSMTDFMSENWSNYSDAEHVILGKFIYSLRILSELNISLLGINGILSAVCTRVIFDNYWQSKYLIENNKVDEYRQFTLDRLRLHILKRTDRKDINDIDILMIASQSDIIAPIPVNGDYFTKSPREICIKLNLKDEYDKYYEYNSEFIHSSLTAVLSGIMTECSNPEHGFHLTVNPTSSRYIDSVPHIIEILNMHIDLVNNFIGNDIFIKFTLDELYCRNRKEFLTHMDELNRKVQEIK